MKLVRNRARCLDCSEVVESLHTHDYRQCRCGALAVDGGLSYARRSYNRRDRFEELSEYAERGAAV